MTIAACGCEGAGMDWDETNCTRGHGGVKVYIGGDHSKNSFDNIIKEIQNEAEITLSRNGKFVKEHEALGVIREEYIEYEEEVFKFNLRKGRDTRPEMRTELIQLAAMCVRAIHDLNLG